MALALRSELSRVRHSSPNVHGERSEALPMMGACSWTDVLEQKVSCRDVAAGYSISDDRVGDDSSRFRKVIIMVIRSSMGRKFKISCF